MKPVQTSLAETMKATSWDDPEVPLVANFSGRVVSDAEGLREALITQIASPVRWVDCVQTLVDAGCTSFLELGPGRVLSGLVRQVAGGDVDAVAADSRVKLAQFAQA
jgi:[acyl-carrier-protein] S-malonyltransferase